MADLANMQRFTRRRIELLTVLAKPGLLPGTGVCDGCKLVIAIASMEVDHVDGKLWTSSGLSPHRRVARYWQEYLAGVRLRALCKTCNSRGGAERTNRKRYRRKAKR